MNNNYNIHTTEYSASYMPGYGEIITTYEDDIATKQPDNIPSPIPSQMPTPSETNIPSFPNNISDNNTDMNSTYILFLYPTEARQIKEIVNNKLNTLDYDGSIIFHQYPDKTAIYDIISQIKVPFETDTLSPNWLQQLIEVIFLTEMDSRRNLYFNLNNNSSNIISPK